MSNIEKAIGVFDSGMGGISVLKTLHTVLPQENLIYYGDSKFAPYGEKTREEITQRCMEICDFFIEKGVKAIVVACNTATSACINILREKYKDIPIIGMEPALKVACNCETKQNVLVLATPFTLREPKFNNLMARYENQHNIYKQPCPKLVRIVENRQLNDQVVVLTTLKEYLSNYDLSQINSIVLGCTHFVFYKKYFTQILPTNIHLIDGNLGTIQHLQHILEDRKELKYTRNIGNVEIFNSSDDEDMIKLSWELFSD